MTCLHRAGTVGSGSHSPIQGFWTLLSGSFSAVSASALWVDFDGHQTVTVTMDHLPGAVLSPVDRRRSQPHFLRLTVDMPSEPLKLDCEADVSSKPVTRFSALQVS